MIYAYIGTVIYKRLKKHLIQLFVRFGRKLFRHSEAPSAEESSLCQFNMVGSFLTQTTTKVTFSTHLFCDYFYVQIQ